MGRGRYRVFVSHTSADRWVAEQIARRLEIDCRCETFIDVVDVEKGDDVEARVYQELPKCRELLALLTPAAADRNWIWAEIGAARLLGLRIVAVLYGLTLKTLDKKKGGSTFLSNKNIVEINDLETYFEQVTKRAEK